MPPVEDQMKLSGSETTDFVAARFLLKPGRSYSEAVKLFSPYRETKEPNLAARKTIRELLKKKKRRNSFVFVNNRLEGNALKTIQAAT